MASEPKGLYKVMVYEDRKKIEELYSANVSLSSMADATGYSESAIRRELWRGYTGRLDQCGRKEYCAALAQSIAAQSAEIRGHRGEKKYLGIRGNHRKKKEATVKKW